MVIDFSSLRHLKLQNKLPNVNQNHDPTVQVVGDRSFRQYRRIPLVAAGQPACLRRIVRATEHRVSRPGKFLNSLLQRLRLKLESLRMPFLVLGALMGGAVSKGGVMPRRPAGLLAGGQGIRSDSQSEAQALKARAAPGKKNWRAAHRLVGESRSRSQAMDAEAPAVQSPQSVSCRQHVHSSGKFRHQFCCVHLLGAFGSRRLTNLA